METTLLKKIIYSVAALGILFAGGALSSYAVAQEGAKITNEPGLFQEFGGKEGLTRIMDDFMVNLLADARTAPFFKDVDQARVKDKLVEQFCDILNGGCKYAGAAMKPIHSQLNINREHFNALVEQLQLAMDKNRVPFRAQNKLLAVLAPMHRDIIAK
jgi:hemoglobin